MKVGRHRKLLVTYRLFFGLLGLSAIVTEVVVLVQRGTFTPANFFSFFTVQSNLLAAAVLIAGALMLWRNKRPAMFDLLRGATTLYMVVTGVIFAILLSGLDAEELTAVPWDNTVLHYIMPLAVFADWLLDSPRRHITFGRALAWLLYPVAYLFYTLIRGHFAGWYPYPFLNVNDKGYMAVLVASIAVAVFVIGLSWLVAKTARPHSRIFFQKK
jgi:hypothetical protein